MHPDDLDEVIALVGGDERLGRAVPPGLPDARRRRPRRVVPRRVDRGPRRGRADHLVAGRLIDITERKAAEQRLLDAERVYRATVEHLPATVYREPPHVEQRAADFYISPRVEDLLGLHARRMAGRRPPRSGPSTSTPRTASGSWRATRRSTAPRSPSPRTTACVARTARTYGSATRPRSSPTSREAGGRASSSTSVSGWRPRPQLREAEETFRSIVERNPAVIYTQEFDAQDGISRTTYVSPRQPEVFGYTRGGGHQRSDPVGPDDPPRGPRPRAVGRHPEQP